MLHAKDYFSKLFNPRNAETILPWDESISRAWKVSFLVIPFLYHGLEIEFQILSEIMESGGFGI